MPGKICASCDYVAESIKEKTCPICQQQLEVVCDNCGQAESTCACSEPEELCETCNNPVSQCDCI